MGNARIAIASLAIVASIAAVGCGSGQDRSKTLDKQDQQQLTERTDQFQKSLQATVTGLTTCLKDAAKAGGLAAISACVDQLLSKSAATAEELATYVTGLKAKVTDKCGKQLEAMSAAAKEIGDSLKTAGTAIGKGDTAGFQAAIGGLSGSGGKLQGAVAAVGSSCVG